MGNIFPYDDHSAPLTPQAILAGVATSTTDGYGALRVSAIFSNAGSVTTSPLSADSSKISAVQGDANILHTSSFSNDAGLFRVSAVGGTAGDHTLVDGTTQTISATLTPVSASPAGSVAGLVVNAQSYDAGKVHVSAYASDAGLFRVSAIGGTTGDHTLVDGTTQSISATLTPISAKPAGSVAGLVVNTFQSDASQFRVSAILAAGVSSTGAASFGVSAAQIDAGAFHTSSFVDSGSISARSGDANQFHVSAVQGDAGLLHVSVVGTLTVSAHEIKQSDAAALRISAILAAGVSSVGAASFGVSAAQLDAGVLRTSALQGDASLQRISAFESVVTTNTGGASVLYSSAISGQTSANIKTTAGRLYGYHIYNPAGVDQYLQMFNVSGFPTLGTDVPYMSLGVPTLGGAVMSLGAGIGFSTGLVIMGTSTAAGNSIAASALRVNIFYA